MIHWSGLITTSFFGKRRSCNYLVILSRLNSYIIDYVACALKVVEIFAFYVL